MSHLVLRAYLKLICFELDLARGNFAALYQKVRNFPVDTLAGVPDVTESVCT